MRVAQKQGDVLAVALRPVSDANQLQLLHVPLAESHDHVVGQAPVTNQTGSISSRVTVIQQPGLHSRRIPCQTNDDERILHTSSSSSIDNLSEV
jgi:hypothetical protein